MHAYSGYYYHRPGIKCFPQKNLGGPACSPPSPRSPATCLMSPSISLNFLIYISRIIWCGLPRWLSGEEPACQCRKTGEANSVPGIGRSPGGGNGNPLQYSCLENPTDRGAWWATVHEVTESDMISWLSTAQHKSYGEHCFNWLLLISRLVICISGPFFLLLGSVLFGEGNGTPLQ